MEYASLRVGDVLLISIDELGQALEGDGERLLRLQIVRGDPNRAHRRRAAGQLPSRRSMIRVLIRASSPAAKARLESLPNIESVSDPAADAMPRTGRARAHRWFY